MLRHHSFLLGLTAPLVLRTRTPERLRSAVLVAGFPLATFALYVAYLVFEDWQYLRFLLPAYPAVCAGVGAVVVWGIARLRYSALAVGAGVALVACVAFHGWGFARRENVFEIARQDQRYARAVIYAQGLASNAVLVSSVYSGTLHFYTGRDVLRWDAIAPGDIDRAAAYLRSRGHPLYFIGDPFEAEAFRRRFAGTRTAGAVGGRMATSDQAFVAYNLQ